jgi:CheY-like chemotaxis protein
VGLSVVRSLVEMHGGSIEAQSGGVGSGSRFVARLPLSSRPLLAPAERGKISWPAGKRVVVVEDNPDGREMLTLLLEGAGYDVASAPDGKSGLELILAKQPDIAIVDIGLPEMDGFEVARRVCARAEQRPYMVALTGYGQESDHVAALDAGFDEHLVKPLDPDELKRLIRTRPE